MSGILFGCKGKMNPRGGPYDRPYKSIYDRSCRKGLSLKKLLKQRRTAKRWARNESEDPNTNSKEIARGERFRLRYIYRNFRCGLQLSARRGGRCDRRNRQAGGRPRSRYGGHRDQVVSPAPGRLRAGEIPAG